MDLIFRSGKCHKPSVPHPCDFLLSQGWDSNILNPPPNLSS